LIFAKEGSDRVFRKNQDLTPKTECFDDVA
jgi:hypothetical protein